MLKNYELTYTEKPDIAKEKSDLLKEKLLSLITTDGGHVSEEKVIENRTINTKHNKKMRVTLYIMHITVLPDIIAEIKQTLLVNEFIVNHFILKASSVSDSIMTPFDFSLAQA